jgi:hypothetical protein
MRLTGITYDVKAKLIFLNNKKVKILALRGVEYSDRITSQWFYLKKIKFKNSFRALLFIARINKKQFKYYPDLFKI